MSMTLQFVFVCVALALKAAHHLEVTVRQGTPRHEIGFPDNLAPAKSPWLYQDYHTVPSFSHHESFSPFNWPFFKVKPPSSHSPHGETVASSPRRDFEAQIALLERRVMETRLANQEAEMQMQQDWWAAEGMEGWDNRCRYMQILYIIIYVCKYIYICVCVCIYYIYTCMYIYIYTCVWDTLNVCILHIYRDYMNK